MKVKLITMFYIGAIIAQAQLITDSPHLTISSFNDSWGGGFTEIHDDKRTTGVDLDYQFNVSNRVMQTQLTYSVFTNRLVPDSTRLDELAFIARYPVWQPIKNFRLSVHGGGYLTGDLGGQTIQNEVHSSVSVSEFDLPYPNANILYTALGASAWWHDGITAWSDGHQLGYEAYLYYEEAFSYFRRINGQIGLSVSNKYSDKIALSLGYQDYTIHISDQTRRAVGETESSLYSNFSFRLGAAFFGMTVYDEFSMGYLGISLLNWKDRKDLQTIDLTTEFGSLTDGNGFYLRFLWNKLTNNRENLQFDLHYQFWTLTASKLATYPANHGHYQQFSLGANYYFIKPKPKFQILPYVDLRIGYKDERVYPGEQRKINFNYNVWSFNAIGEVGTRIKLPAKVIHNNCYYGLTVNYQYAASLYKSNDVQLAYGYEFARNLGYGGIGAFVMIDL